MKKIQENIECEINVLLKEYDHRFEEVKQYSKRYNFQANVTYGYIMALIGVITLLLSDHNLFANLSSSIRSLFVFVISLFSIIVAYYLYTILQDALAMIYINGNRIGTIEKSINKILNKEILTWDHKIIIRYHRAKSIIKGWVRPSVMMVVWAFLVIVFLNLILIFVCYLFSKQYFWIYVGISVALLIFHLWQTFAFNLIGVNFFSKIAETEENTDL